MVSLKELGCEGTWIQTFSGGKVNPLNPDPETIHIIDIAESLSKQCRFTGHTHKFYSTARHSINCFKLMRLMIAGRYVSSASELDRRVKLLSALLHDGGEAILSDIARPVKHSGGMEEYRAIEEEIELAISQRFRTLSPKDPVVKLADNVMLRQEAEELLLGGPLGDWHLSLPTFERWNLMPKNWHESDPKKDCDEFLELYGKYKY